MELIPAIDLRGGNVVRLAQGDYERQTRYPVDPIELAASYRASGAAWLHVVDLDGARAGGLQNLSVVSALASTGLRVQVGGGVRDRSDVEALFAAGASRVVVGSLAVREPEKVEKWISEFGADKLCIALDTRLIEGVWTLPSFGWLNNEQARLEGLASRYAAAGAMHLLCTDIDRDGMLAGPNVALYRLLRERVPTMRIQASGGVRDLADLAELAAVGVAGAILGRSLLEGRVVLAEALAC
jgi:phosphoribosylformimino-5-aminoimidazole carboxamide ribotide isomerase